MKVFIATDHRGYKLKQQVVDFLKSQNFEVVDCGNTEFNVNDDYPDFTLALSQKIASENNFKGIIFCGSGIGVSICANRFNKIRCGLCTSVEQTRAARNDDDINVLAIASDFVNFETVVSIVKTFLNTPFSNQERHIRRLNKTNKLCT